MLAPFKAPRLKIARARRHIDELKTAIDAYLALDPVVIVVEPWSADPKHVAWTVRIKLPVPIELSAIIGDAVHNLRTALDLTANDLVRAQGKNTKGVYFPFAHSEHELRNQIKRRNFDRAGPEAVALLKHIAPYKNGNIGLRALHDLDIADKHEALMPVLQTAVMDLSGIAPGANDATKAQLKQWGSCIDHDGQEMVIMPDGWGPRQGSVIKANYVVWTQLDPRNVEAGGHEVISLLAELARIVENIVNEFGRIASL